LERSRFSSGIDDSTISPGPFFDCIYMIRRIRATDGAPFVSRRKKIQPAVVSGERRFQSLVRPDSPYHVNTIEKRPGKSLNHQFPEEKRLRSKTDRAIRHRRSIGHAI